MTALTSNDVLRPAPGGLKAQLMERVMALVPFGFRLLRRFWPILRLGRMFVVTLYDDVSEVFATDTAFGVVYTDNLKVITGGEDFFLGLPDSTEYQAQLAAMRRVVAPSDLPALGDRAEALAEAIVSASGGRVEVVSLVRRVTFGLIAPYFGVPEPNQGRLDVWATRLFEYQFTGSPSDTALRAEVDEIAPAFRAHIDREISRRKATPDTTDDVLRRCLNLQAAGEVGYSDLEIRTALLCMVVGGPPQPPIVVPQAMEQLLRRPGALAAAHDAAVDGRDANLHDIVLEAMRFDPLAPGLPRIALKDWTVARGTKRATVIPRGAKVLAAFASAMMDERRLPEPQRFKPGRLPYEYIHFGHGMHECFGRHINHATLHRMLKPLLRRPGLRRAEGPDGKLRKAGIFADRLSVLFD
ncbi:MAG TPA: cytochrome P450 [Roseiarcus sp.]|jgi:cytochrome P450|nr:cytochrome P450 [Roseiarcus sp.]